MATVGFTKLASGTINPGETHHWWWNNASSHFRVRALWFSIEPFELVGGNIAEGHITNAWQKVIANPFNRQIHVEVKSTSNTKATYDIYMASIGP
jgi:hypothetical protein